MKILVTGATSGLGRNAVQWLLDTGHQVRASGRQQAAGAALRRCGAQFVPLDLASASDSECEALVEGVDAIWHCAARSAPWGPLAGFQADNVTATAKLAEAAGRQGVLRFVHVSTPAVYFDFSHRLDIVEEAVAKRFVNAYAASKFAAEKRIGAAVERHPGTRYVILRPRALFGPHDRTLLPRLLARIDQDGGVLRLPRGGQARLDLTYVLNVVHAMHLATVNPRPRSGAAYNITNHAPCRLVDQLDSLLRQEMGLEVRFKTVPYRLLHGVAGAMELGARLSGREPALTRYSVGAVNFDMTLDNRRAITELDYRPPYSLDQGIAHTAAWLRQQHELRADG